MSKLSELDGVELSIPVQADLVVLARLTAATVASRAGFAVEEIEDLRLAVEELCLSLVPSSSQGRLHLSYRWRGDTIEISCSLEAAEGMAPGSAAAAARDSPLAEGEMAAPAADLSLRILDALVDDHGRDVAQGRARAWLRKRVSSTV